jgi:Ca2+-binding EF-hand superfamily protein
MDYYNIIKEIVPKMRIQMHNHSIPSLTQVYYLVNQNQGSSINKFMLDITLSQLGIYLKSQEVSELSKYLDKHSDSVKLDKFAELFKKELSKEAKIEIEHVFDNYAIPGKNISIDELLNNFNPFEHPQLMGVKNDPRKTFDSMREDIYFIAGNKSEMTKKDFDELHRNIWSIMPDDYEESFIYQIALMWNIKRYK